MTLGFDAASLGGPAKTEILDLRFYTNAELDLLPAQERHLFRRGIRPSRSQKRRAAGAGPMRAMRLQWAALPFLVLLLTVGFLGVHRPRAVRRRALLVAAFCLLLLLPLTILLDLRARDGRLSGAALAGLPTLVVAAAILGAAVVRWIPARWRR